MGSTGIITTHNDGGFLLSSETRSFANISVDASNPDKIPDFIRVENPDGTNAFSLWFAGKTTREEYNKLLSGWRGRMNVIERSARRTYDKTYRDAIKAGKTPQEAASAARDARDISNAKAFKKFAKSKGIDMTLKSRSRRYRSI